MAQASLFDIPQGHAGESTRACPEARLRVPQLSSKLSCVLLPKTALPFCGPGLRAVLHWPPFAAAPGWSPAGRKRPRGPLGKIDTG